MSWIGPSLIKKIFLSNLVRLDEPYKVTFSVTDSCNSKCKTCNIWKKERKDELTPEEVTRVFENLNTQWVNLTGGEVFLRDDVFEIAQSIKKNADPCVLNLTTNGMMTDKIVSTVKRLDKLGFPKFLVVVSIDGPESVHDNVRGVKGSWKKSVETYSKLKGMPSSDNFGVFIGYTISEHNLGFLEEAYSHVKAVLSEVRKDDFHFNLFHVSPHYYSNNNMITKTDRAEFLEDVEKAGDSKRFGLSPISILEKRYLRILRGYVKDGRVPFRCAALSASCYIGPTGDVYPCLHLDRKLGNLRENGYDLLKIWNSERAKRVRKDIKDGKCPGCWSPCDAYQTILANLFRMGAWKYL